MDLIKTIEQEEIKRLGKEIPDFAPGDTVLVNVNVVEGERKRVQAFEGMVIAKRNRGLNSSFIVRKISSVEVKRKGDVRRASSITCARARASRLAFARRPAAPRASRKSRTGIKSG